MTIGEPPTKRPNTAIESKNGDSTVAVSVTVPTHVLRVKKLSAAATLPKRGSTGAAGYDLSRFVAAIAKFGDSFKAFAYGKGVSPCIVCEGNMRVVVLGCRMCEFYCETLSIACYAGSA